MPPDSQMNRSSDKAAVRRTLRAPCKNSRKAIGWPAVSPQGRNRPVEASNRQASSKEQAQRIRGPQNPRTPQASYSRVSLKANRKEADPTKLRIVTIATIARMAES